jgi:hypothetical protein
LGIGPTEPFTPSNVDRAGHFELTGLDLQTPTAATFDTDADCTANALLGRCTRVGTGPGRSPGLCVCRSDRLTVQDLVVTGPNALVILAWTRVQIRGRVTVAAGASPSSLSPNTGLSGGVGGSFGTSGGSSGMGAVSPDGTPWLVPLLGGQAGQGASCGGSSGGAAGGAIQVSAGSTLTIGGIIDASGAGGAGGEANISCAGGAGGGSGGGILVESRTTSISGELVAAGGGGGGGGSESSGGGRGGAGSSNGGGGSSDTGGGCALYGYTSGGGGGPGSSNGNSGGRGGDADEITGCLGPVDFVGQGGGGGGSGLIRLNSRAPCLCSALIVPAPSIGSL